MLSFRFLTVLALCTSTVFASSQIRASSPLGLRLLSSAQRRVNNNNNDDAIDFSWVADYSIRFDSCHTTLEFRADGGGNSGDAAEDGAPTESMRLVQFKLCPTDSCGSNSCQHGADYLVEMREFVEAYLEFQMTQQEYNCAQVEDNCDCENANDDQACLSACYATAGLDYCENNQNDNNNNNGNNNGYDFELDRYLECERLNDNNNNNGYSSSVYVGAYCSKNGKAIYLGTFSDRQCTQLSSDNSAFKSYTGYDLPYTSESIVSNQCLSCREPSNYDDDYYNADRQDADEVVEMCEELYQRSAKCEGNLQNSAYTQYTGGCDYINKFLPRAERLAAGVNGSKARAWAWIFGITTVLLAVYAFFLYRRIARLSGGKVNLSSQ